MVDAFGSLVDVASFCGFVVGCVGGWVGWLLTLFGWVACWLAV